MAALQPLLLISMKPLLRRRTIERTYEAGHLGIGVQRDEVVQISSFDRAKQQPLGFDTHNRSALDNVHADYQPIFEAVAVTDVGVGDETVGACLVNHLMNIYSDRTVSLLGEGLGLDLAGDFAELSFPVVTNCWTAENPATLPSVGPIDPGMHQLKRRVDFACVERTIGAPQDLQGIRHATKHNWVHLLASGLFREGHS